MEGRRIREIRVLKNLANHTGTIGQTGYKNVTGANKLDKGIETADSEIIYSRRSPRQCKKANKSVQIQGDKKTTKQHVQVMSSTNGRISQTPAFDSGKRKRRHVETCTITNCNAKEKSIDDFESNHISEEHHKLDVQPSTSNKEDQCPSPIVGKYPRRSLRLKNKAGELESKESGGHETNQMMQVDMYPSFVASSAHTSKSKPVERKQAHEIDTTFYGKEKIKRDTKKDVKDLNKMTADLKTSKVETRSAEKVLNKAVKIDDIAKNLTLDCYVDNLDKLQTQNKEVKVREICEAITNESSDILHVEPVYKADDENKAIHFLVFAKTEIILTSKFKTVLRISNKFSDESLKAIYCEDNSPLPMKASREIEEIIDEHSRDLFRDHKYLTCISASSVISEHFGTPNYKLKKQHCIVLNVLVKGLIPLDEKPFPTRLKGIPVDVREGGFQFCAKPAQEFQENLRIGCKITSQTGGLGTLGGYIEHYEYGLCGITCAHVVLNDKTKLTKAKCHEEEFNDITIYQPDKEDKNEIGKTVKVIYKEGTDESPGVDLALFKIDKRAPTNGLFPAKQQNFPLAFTTGLVWGKTGIPTSQYEVLKFGCASGFTKGILQCRRIDIQDVDFENERGKTVENEHEKTVETLNLYKQYLIKSSDMSDPFAYYGDSGSLVFMEDKSGEKPEVRCIGMVVAINETDRTCLVTPITSIIDELKVNQMKSFVSNDMMNEMNGRFDRLETMITTLRKDIKSK